MRKGTKKREKRKATGTVFSMLLEKRKTCDETVVRAPILEPMS